MASPRQQNGGGGLEHGSPRTEPFSRHHRRYERWFERHRAAYLSELLAVRALLPWSGRGLEIGVGTGRFAGPLGVAFGMDPAVAMLGYARRRGVGAVAGVAEALPFADAVFDYVLVVTTICFVEDPWALLREARRVLRPGGQLVLGLVDRESPLGQEYLAQQAANVFYRAATFYSATDVATALEQTGFSCLSWVQTLGSPPAELRAIEPTRAGTGEGAFLVVRAQSAGGAADSLRPSRSSTR